MWRRWLGWIASGMVIALAGCDESSASAPGGDALEESSVRDPGTDAAPDAPFLDEDPSPDLREVREEGPVLDARNDASEEVSGDLPPLVVPFQPRAPVKPVVDAPFLQEFNHTGNEVDPELVPLVAVLLPPPGFDREGVLQVTPRGLAWEQRAGHWRFLGPGDGEADLIAGAGGPGFVALAGPAVLYRLGPDGSVDRQPVPEGLTVLGLETLQGEAWMRTSAGAAPIPPTGFIRWPTMDPPVTALARALDGHLLAGHPDGTVTIHEPGVDNLPGPPQEHLDLQAAGAIRGLVPAVTLPVPLDLVVIGDGGVRGLRRTAMGSWEAVEVPLFAPDRVPLDRPRTAVPTWDGGFVVATEGGAYRVMERDEGPEWRFYGAERWLPHEEVRGIATDPSIALAPLYFATPGGLGFVTARWITLEEKLRPFVDRVVQRHDRDGAVADSRLMRKGDLSTNIPWDSDNDGSWTAYWLMAECARWRVTGDPAARAHFDRSLDAMLFLREATGTDWFVARSVIRKEGCRLDDCEQPDDGQWWVKRDTSNDELMPTSA